LDFLNRECWRILNYRGESPFINSTPERIIDIDLVGISLDIGQFDLVAILANESQVGHGQRLPQGGQNER
jgi:hypothetical protein